MARTWCSSCTATARRRAEGKAAAKLLRPLVIDALQFKQDKEGYLTAESRTHLYLLDVRTGACEALTSDPNREDSAPAFSADGREIAFVSNPLGSDLGRDEIELVAAEKGAVPRKLLTTYSPNHQTLLWSPDGTLLAFLEGAEPKFNAYITDRLAVADVKTGKVRGLTDALDRAVYTPALCRRRPLDPVRGRGRWLPVPGRGERRERGDHAPRRCRGGARSGRGRRSHRGAGLE